MRMRILVMTALLTNALLGNVCMMNMAYAAMPPGGGHEDAMGMMSMAPVDPMSAADCPHCDHDQDEGGRQAPAPTSSPCDSGHCISSHGQEVSGTVKESPLPIQGIVPVTFQDVMAYPHDDMVLLRNTERPPLVSGTSTIVLRE